MSYVVERLFTETLKKNNLHSTPERLFIFEVLKIQGAPCSVKQLVELTKSKMNMTTVYRNLDIFESIGITTRIYTGWKYKIELSDSFSPHHHHMTCTDCGKVISFNETKEFSNELKKLEKQYRFRSKSHLIELRGLCDECS